MKRTRSRQPDQVREADVEHSESMTEEAMMDFTAEELREFLQADLLDVAVDPRFKERLRRRLWELVQEQSRRRPPGGD